MNIEKNIVIVGSGGFAKEIYSYLRYDVRTKRIDGKIRIKGFLDVNKENFLTSKIHEAYLGNEDTFFPEENDYFLVAIGQASIRNKIIAKLEANKYKFYTYIHSGVFISETSRIEEGVIICPHCVVNPNAYIGKHCILNIYSSIAHDCELGSHSILSPYCTLNGNVKTGSHLFMGTNSAILYGLKIGNCCTIAAGTIVKKDMEDEHSAFLKARVAYLKKI